MVHDGHTLFTNLTHLAGLIRTHEAEHPHVTNYVVEETTRPVHDQHGG